MAPNTSNDSTATLRRLKKQLRSAYARTKAGRRIGAILFFFCFLLISFLGLTAVESIFYLSSSAKIYTSAAIIVLSLMAVFGIDRKLSRPTRQQFINQYLKTRGKEGEQIQSALDLFENTEQKSSIFYEAALESNLRVIDFIEFKTDLSRYLRNRRDITFLRASTVGLLLAIVGFTLTLSFYPRQR